MGSWQHTVELGCLVNSWDRQFLVVLHWDVTSPNCFCFFKSSFFLRVVLGHGNTEGKVQRVPIDLLPLHNILHQDGAFATIGEPTLTHCNHADSIVHSWDCTSYGFGQIYNDICASQVVLVVKNPPANAGDVRDEGLSRGLGRSPGGGHGNPLQYFCLEDPIDREAWLAKVHGVAKSQSDCSDLACMHHDIYLSLWYHSRHHSSTRNLCAGLPWWFSG